MKNEIMKQLKNIYKSIAELNAYNKYRTNRNDLKKIAGVTSRVYLLSDIADAARDEGIMTGDELNEITDKLREALRQLTILENENLAEFNELA